MLTQEQKDKLESFTKHPKFGKLLVDAIITWEEINPAIDEYGVKVDFSDKGLIVKDRTKGCCLIGASVLNKISFDYSIDRTARKYFELSNSDVEEIIDGFDDVYEENRVNSEAYRFARNIGQIVLK